jgi:hypothetical protein
VPIKESYWGFWAMLILTNSLSTIWGDSQKMFIFWVGKVYYSAKTVLLLPQMIAISI